ncbi:ATP-binding protein [Thauera humireducens]|uniref:ATP-binding protein n=1 Tax=Thauera humireducens TaxID=1134435 RepID=UPI002A4E2004|nr:ATP-binding protein [Thauera humireducens]
MLDGFEFCGELSLNGELRAVRGVLAVALAAGRARRGLVVATANAPEAALMRSANVLPAGSLCAVAAHLNGHTPLQPAAFENPAAAATSGPDLADVRGQLQARRALEVAAAGTHSLLLFGPPGTGKSMLAQRLPGLLPPMPEGDVTDRHNRATDDRHIEATRTGL